MYPKDVFVQSRIRAARIDEKGDLRRFDGELLDRKLEDLSKPRLDVFVGSLSLCMQTPIGVRLKKQYVVLVRYDLQ